MTNTKNLFRLFSLMTEKPQTLSVKLDLQTLVEFSVAAKVMRARSVSAFVHQYVMEQIKEARHQVTPSEWKKMVEEQTKMTLARSQEKSSLRQSNVEPIKGAKIVNARHIGELTDESRRSQKKKGAQ